MITKAQADYYNNTVFFWWNPLDIYEDDFLLELKAGVENIISWSTQKIILDAVSALELKITPKDQLEKLPDLIEDILKNNKNTREYQIEAHIQRADSWQNSDSVVL